VSTVIIPLACLDHVVALLYIWRIDELLVVWRPALLLPISFKQLIFKPPPGRDREIG
jgi:hypothetical protein